MKRRALILFNAFVVGTTALTLVNPVEAIPLSLELVSPADVSGFPIPVTDVAISNFLESQASPIVYDAVARAYTYTYKSDSGDYTEVAKVQGSFTPDFQIELRLNGDPGAASFVDLSAWFKSIITLDVDSHVGPFGNGVATVQIDTVVEYTSPYSTAQPLLDYQLNINRNQNDPDYNELPYYSEVEKTRVYMEVGDSLFINSHLIVASISQVGFKCGTEAKVDAYNNEGGLYIHANIVPEPTTLLLFGTGLAGLAGSGLRRKKK